MMNNRRKIMTLIFVFVILVFGSLFVYYSHNHTNPKDVDIIMIPKTMGGSDFWKSVVEGANLYADENQIELSIMGTETETDIQGQINLIEKAIEEKPTALIVSPLSFSDITPSLEKVKAAGIYLVLMDSVIDKDIADSIVSTDNIIAGESLGEMGYEILEDTYGQDQLNEIQIGVIGHVQGSSTAIQREEGVRAGLQQYEEQIVAVEFCDSSYSKAEEIAMTMMQMYPELSLIIGLNENASVGAARGIKIFQEVGQVHCIGFDSSQEEVMLIEEGVLQGIVIQQPINMGYLAVEASVMLALGEEVEPFIDSGSKVINMENLYEDKNQKMLFPLTEQNE